MTARSTWIFTLLFIALACTRDEESTPRNLILISLDTVGAKHLGAYGHDRPTSPNLDAFAADGILFENAIAPAPWTLPSHASLFTGLYPNLHGARILESSLADDVPTLAGVLSDHGFASAAFVNGIFMAEIFGLARGFDTYEFIPEDHSARGAASRISDRALAWLEEQRGRRAFLFVHYFDVHSDYRSQARFERLFDARRDLVNGTTDQLLEVIRGEIALGPNEVEALERLYDAGIRQLDDDLGQLFAQLASRGWLEDSLIIVTSDHGEEFMEHGRVLHTRSHYDELLRVPLIFRGPSLPGGLRVATPVSLVDVAPTVSGLLGVPFPAGGDGRDLRPLWESPGSPPAERLIFSEGGPSHKVDAYRSVRDERHKLWIDLETGRQELYDWLEDPGEVRNLLSERPDVAVRLGAAIEARAEQRRDNPHTPQLPPETEEQLRQLGYH
jgi:arylsulfatase A-like enzyme